MKLLSKSIVGLLIVSVIGLYFPGVSFCTDAEIDTGSGMKQITWHKPKVMSEPEKDIPVVATKAVENKGLNWLWIGGAAALVVGLAAAAGGGDSGDSDGSDGNISVSW